MEGKREICLGEGILTTVDQVMGRDALDAPPGVHSTSNCAIVSSVALLMSRAPQCFTSGATVAHADCAFEFQGDKAIRDFDF